MPDSPIKETRTTRRHAESFRSLVRSGLAVIAQRGLYETTVEHITEAADLGKGTFYAHFSSKEDLVRHLLQDGFDELIAANQGLDASEAHPAERLAALLRAQFAVLARRRDLIILLHQVRGLLIIEPRARQALRQEYQRYVDFLAEACRRALDRPQLGPAEARDLACAVAGFVAGTLSFEMLIRRTRVRPAALAGPIHAFAAGLAARYVDGHPPPAGAPGQGRRPKTRR
ncbi:MAG: TetR/AcrR family transcriptional regulator [Candidatus Methylomirabilales bacterium]